MGAATSRGILAVVGADGAELKVGVRVATQLADDEGGDGEWYSGVITAIGPFGTSVSIRYDDGDKWTGSPKLVWQEQAVPGEGGEQECRLPRKAFVLTLVLCGVTAFTLFVVSFSTRWMRAEEVGLWYQVDTCKTADGPTPRYEMRPGRPASLSDEACPTVLDPSATPTFSIPLELDGESYVRASQ